MKKNIDLYEECNKILKEVLSIEGVIINHMFEQTPPHRVYTSYKVVIGDKARVINIHGGRDITSIFYNKDVNDWGNDSVLLSFDYTKKVGDFWVFNFNIPSEDINCILYYYDFLETRIKSERMRYSDIEEHSTHYFNLIRENIKKMIKALTEPY